MNRTNRLLAVAFSAIALGACASGTVVNIPPDILTHDEALVAIPKDDSTIGIQRASTGTMDPGKGGDFYLAVKKTELGKKWFLTAFLTQYFPGQVNLGAARSLGTRVVSFKTQNGKVYVFDADKNHQTSNISDPQVLVEAYPMVSGYAPFEALDNASQYVLFDPASGLNKFAVGGDTFADPYLTNQGGGTTFTIGLSFMQNFRKISDGVTYEQVFTGNGVYNDGVNAPFEYRASGTLGIGLRSYGEGEGYTPTQIADAEYYFRSDWHAVPNSGGYSQTAIHWNFHPGMKPITWWITPGINEFAKQFPNAKVVDAVKAGIENWNAVFGYKVFEAKVATDDSVIGQDDKNLIIVDQAPEMGYAFANWRTNPNTGEIRGASVYLGGVWFDDSQFADDAANGAPANNVTGTANLKKPEKAPKIMGLSWQGMHFDPLCKMLAPKYLMPSQKKALASRNNHLTKNQKFEAFLTSVVVHEVGHTLGLRHNFKGSLVPPSSSVMDYLNNDDSIARATPGAYDVAAIKYLYGLTSAYPQDAFCTDEDITADPDCAMFDTSSDPLNAYYLPYYSYVVDIANQYGSFFLFFLDLNEVLSYSRAGADGATALKAFNAAMATGHVPAPSSVTSNPDEADTADTLAWLVLTRLYLDGPDYRGYIGNDPFYPEVNAAALAEVKGNLTNADGIRSFPTRRSMVDILKKLQTNSAFQALRDSQTTIQAARASMTGQQAALTDDLLARINQALSPYFLN